MSGSLQPVISCALKAPVRSIQWKWSRGQGVRKLVVKRWERTPRMLARISLTTPSRSFGARPGSTPLDPGGELIRWRGFLRGLKQGRWREKERPHPCRQGALMLTDARLMDRIDSSRSINGRCVSRTAQSLTSKSPCQNTSSNAKYQAQGNSPPISCEASLRNPAAC